MKEQYNNFKIPSNFEVARTVENEILQIMYNIKMSEADKIEKFSGRFLKDCKSSKILAIIFWNFTLL